MANPYVGRYTKPDYNQREKDYLGWQAWRTEKKKKANSYRGYQKPAYVPREKFDKYEIDAKEFQRLKTIEAKAKIDNAIELEKRRLDTLKDQSIKTEWMTFDGGYGGKPLSYTKSPLLLDHGGMRKKNIEYLIAKKREFAKKRLAETRKRKYAANMGVRKAEAKRRLNAKKAAAAKKKWLFFRKYNSGFLPEDYMEE